MRLSPRLGLVDIVLDGKPLIATSFEGVYTDPPAVDLFPERSARDGRYPQRDQGAFKTSLTFHFEGADAHRVREIVQALMNRA